MKANKKYTKIWIVAIGCLVVILLSAWFLLVRLEGEKPTIELDLHTPYIGRTQQLSISAADTKSGLRRLWVGLLKDGKEVVLDDVVFPSAGLLKGGKIHETLLNIPVEPIILGLTDGEATLRMVVRDYSWRGWWNGNQTYVEKTIVIDTRPPEIEVLSRAHNIRQGGAGLVIFRTSESCPQSGVQVGDNFFPGHAGFYNDPHVYIAFIALAYHQGSATAIFVKATDQAGNSAKSGLNHYIRGKVFAKDRINISDRFLNRKIPEFASEIGQNTKMSMVDKFLHINRDLRRADYQRIAA